MICDRCGETVENVEIRRADGTVWCYACAKPEKGSKGKRKRAKSADPFVRMARRLHDLRSTEELCPGYARVILRHSDGLRVYTDGRVLMSERVRMPVQYKLVDIDSLWEVEDDHYVNIDHVLDGGISSDSTVLTVPEDFYTYLRAFNRPRLERGQGSVLFEKDSVTVQDHRDGTVLVYAESSFEIKEPVSFDLGYFYAMKPKALAVPLDVKDLVWVLESYESAISNCIATVFKL